MIECLYFVSVRRDMAGEWHGRRSRGWVNVLCRREGKAVWQEKVYEVGMFVM